MDTPAPGIAQLLHQQQQMMATLVDFLRSTERQPPVTPSLAPRATSARPWKIDVPVLSSPEDSDLTSFTGAPAGPTTCPSLGPWTASRPSRPAKVSSAPRCTRTGQSYGRLEDWTFSPTTISTLSSPNWSATSGVVATRSVTGRSFLAGPKVSTRTSTSSWSPWSGFTTGVRLTTTRRAAAITVATHSIKVAISVISASGTKLFGDSLTRACSGVC